MGHTEINFVQPHRVHGVARRDHHFRSLRGGVRAPAAVVAPARGASAAQVQQDVARVGLQRLIACHRRGGSPLTPGGCQISYIGGTYRYMSCGCGGGYMDTIPAVMRR
jgi:hypothetical protein